MDEEEDDDIYAPSDFNGATGLMQKSIQNGSSSNAQNDAKPADLEEGEEDEEEDEDSDSVC